MARAAIMANESSTVWFCMINQRIFLPYRGLEKIQRHDDGTPKNPVPGGGSLLPLARPATGRAEYDFPPGSRDENSTPGKYHVFQNRYFCQSRKRRIRFCCAAGISIWTGSHPGFLYWPR